MDCGVLRRAIKDAAKLLNSGGSRDPAKIALYKKVAGEAAEHGGIQVLPVQWRHHIDFGKKKKKAETATAQTDQTQKNSATEQPKRYE
ncbi:hypothetical protein HK405_003228 [Cladochytrium tenue]|nr:hypothetical protein HK405_003228 [Cladochytrium tenue]